MVTTTYESNGEKYTITITPPFAGNVTGPDKALDTQKNYNVEVTDRHNEKLYIGVVSSLLAGYFQKNYNCSIPEFLTNAAKVIIDGWSNK